jgi:hypothetical protein
MIEAAARYRRFAFGPGSWGVTTVTVPTSPAACGLRLGTEEAPLSAADSPAYVALVRALDQLTELGLSTSPVD